MGVRMTRLTDDELRMLTAFRHDLHQHPELSGKERRTSEKIRGFLSAIPECQLIDLPIETGVVARITRTPGTSGAPTEVMLRADIDALPQTERVDILWKSSVPGAMHACGHDLHTTAPLTFWNGSSYVARRPGDDNYQMKPFEAFFLQKPNDVEALVYDKSGRMTYKQAQEHHNNKNNNARAAERSERFLINLSLTQGQWEDEARVVYNNKKTTAYEPDCDAAKFMSTMSVPQLYAIEGNVQMAIDERPWGEVQLGFIATAEGEHTITATRLGANVLLRDNLLNITHDLSLGGYTFTTEAGTFNDRFTLVPEAETTDIGATLNEKGERRNEKFFDLQGRRIAEPARGQYIKDGKKFMKK